MKGFLTIGMPTYDDFNGVYFTIKSLQLYHKDVFEQSEIIVVDNNPFSPDGIHTAEFCNRLLAAGYNVKYIPFTENIGTAPAKQKTIESASSEWFLGCDAHVQFVPGALNRLIQYMIKHPNSKDLLCGPLLLDDNKSILTHFAYKWRGENLGIWQTDPRGMDPDGEPFEILGTGMGAFACRRAAWPGFHPKARGFGSEEIYIHEKFRRNGGKALCLPFFKWAHRFGRPRSIPYPLYLWHKVRNYVLEFQELGWDVEEIRQYYVGGGYLSQQDWDLLLSDPVNLYDPPGLMHVALDEKRRVKIKNFVEVNGDKLKELIEKPTENQIQELAKKPEELQKSINKLEAASNNIPSAQEQILPKVPENMPQFKEYTLSEFLSSPEFSEDVKKAISENYKKNPPPDGREPKIRVQVGPQPKSGCSGCKKAKEAVSDNTRIFTELEKLASFSEIETKDFPQLLGRNKIYYEKYIPNQKKIIEFGDDPFGSTFNILKYMDKDAVLVSYYQDRKHLGALVHMRRIAQNEGKIFEFKLFDLDQGKDKFTLFEEVDTVVVDLMSPSFNSLNFVFDKTKDKVKKQYIIHKTGKYGAVTPENNIGQMPAITKFLLDDLHWTTIEHDPSEQGITILSKEAKKQPKIQANAFSMVKSFAKSVLAHIASGGQEVTKEQLQERLSICANCRFRAGERCSICGCFLVNGLGGLGKAKMKRDACPLGYWRPIKD